MAENKKETKKQEVKSQGFFDKLLELVFPPLLDVASNFADNRIDGKELNADQLAGLYNFRSVGKTHFDKLVNSTANKFDNMTLTELVLLAEDTLIEAGVPLNEFPDFKAIADKNKNALSGVEK